MCRQVQVLVLVLQLQQPQQRPVRGRKVKIIKFWKAKNLHSFEFLFSIMIINR